MIRFHAQKGFTLVELAVSLTIIGLLIGGVLKGRQLMENARVAAAVGQVAAIKAATTTFIGTYNGLPGDLKNAHNRIPSCGNCEITGGGAGNGAVGLPNWDLAAAQGLAGIGTAPISNEQSETLLFWAELAQAGLFSGVSSTGNPVAGTTVEFGKHAPAARIGGGFIAGQANGTTVQQLSTPPSSAVKSPKGLLIALVPSPIVPMTSTAGVQVLTQLSAAAIDEKMDDGYALTGSVVAYGYNDARAATKCFTPGARPEPPIPYNEKDDTRDCGLLIQIND